MAREANPVTNASRARVTVRTRHSSLRLRCDKWCSGGWSEVQANLSAIERVANVCPRSSCDILLWGCLSKTTISMENNQELIPTNLAEVDKLPASKVWTSSYGTGGQPTRRIVGLREQNTFSGERRICRLVLLLLYSRLIERRRINSERASSWTRRGLVSCFRCGCRGFLVALSRDSLQERNRCFVRVTVGPATRLVDLGRRNTLCSWSRTVGW
jgi:hypothetical protein